MAHGKKIENPPHMSWKKIVLVLAALLAVAVAVHFGRAGAGKADPVRAPVAVPVEVATVTRGDIALSLKLVGRVEA